MLIGLALLIITIPAFGSLINNQYFSMHDDQHIARLFSLDQGIRQGYLYPRWVDLWGFNHGYPLFNFYPPFIYYVAEFFKLFGVSYIVSIKLMCMTGFLVGAIGMYFLVKKVTENRLAALLSATLFTFYLYHGILIYVRGALAEFFAMSLLPWVFLGIEKIKFERSIKSSIFFGVSFALLILTHPLIAFPSLLYIAIYVLFSLLTLSVDKAKFLGHTILGGIIGLSLSIFFWLPSMLERKFTLVDDILTTELASYKIHYVYPEQLWSSLWGYGGSIPGPIDGLSFQIGKIHLVIFTFSIVTFFICLLMRRISKANVLHYTFYVALFMFSIFMTTQYSSFIWDNIKQLSYLQFPWRFMTFVGIFISIAGGYSIYFLTQCINTLSQRGVVVGIVTVALCLSVVGINGKYFHPQQLINTNDAEKTSFEEIAWRVSRSTFEFMPKGIKTTKSEYNTTIPYIKKEELRPPTGEAGIMNYELKEGKAMVNIMENKFAQKIFKINAATPSVIQFTISNFPGWAAKIDGKEVEINDNNDFKLITLSIPQGSHEVVLAFSNTPVRTIGNWISLTTVLSVATYLLFKQFKKVKG